MRVYVEVNVNSSLKFLLLCLMVIHNTFVTAFVGVCFTFLLQKRPSLGTHRNIENKFVWGSLYSRSEHHVALVRRRYKVLALNYYRASDIISQFHKFISTSFILLLS